MARDPLAVLRPVPIEVDLGGATYTVPPRWADDWLAALAADHGGGIIPGLLDDDERAEVWFRYAAGELDDDELVAASRAVLEVAGGRPWWEVARLVQGAMQPQTWASFAGQIFQGRPAAEMSLGELVNFIYATALAGAADQAERSSFESQLAALPDGVDPDELLDDDEEEAAMLADLEEFAAGG